MALRCSLHGDVGRESAVDRGRVHVANLLGHEERRLRLAAEGGAAVGHERLLHVAVEVRLLQTLLADEGGKIVELNDRYGVLPSLGFVSLISNGNLLAVLYRLINNH